jgi:hypothetical protein
MLWPTIEVTAREQRPAQNCRIPASGREAASTVGERAGAAKATARAQRSSSSPAADPR